MSAVRKYSWIVYALIAFVGSFVAVVLAFAFGLNHDTNQWQGKDVVIILAVVVLLTITWTIATAVLRRKRGSGQLKAW